MVSIGSTQLSNVRSKMKSVLRGGFGIEIFVNAVLPWLVYTQAQPSLGRVHALMASAVPPIVWSVIQLVRKRRLDAFSLFVIAGIGLSLLAFLGGGSYRFLELREHLTSGVMALVFLGSVAIRRPLMIPLLRSIMQRKPQAQDAKAQRLLADRRWLTLLTLGIGLLLLAQTAVAVGLVFTLPVRDFLIVSPIVGYVLLGLFLGVILLYTKHRERTVWAEAEQGEGESSP